MIAESQASRSGSAKASTPAGSQAVMEVIEWLSGEECHETDDAGLIAGLGRRLNAIGLPLDRLTLHLRTLHPEIIGRTVAWARNQAVEIRDREYGIEASVGFAGSPFKHVMETGEPLTIRLDGSNDPTWVHTDLFEGRGLVEFLIVPLSNADGMISAASFSTMRPNGFATSEHAALERIVPALRNACELRTLRKVELPLLDTYVGKTTARRFLAHYTRSVRVETLEAALMLCDLRGFSNLSERLSGERSISLLNECFEHLVPAIRGSGGEVIEFMTNDAVLAFFRHDSDAASCAAALDGALEVMESVASLSLPDAELHWGIALHYGTLAYGSVGVGRRPELAVVGPAFNLVRRIQDISRITGRPLLMSSRFAELLEEEKTLATSHHARNGLDEPTKLYALASVSKRQMKEEIAARPIIPAETSPTM